MIAGKGSLSGFFCANNFTGADRSHAGGPLTENRSPLGRVSQGEHGIDPLELKINERSKVSRRAHHQSP